MISSVAVCSRSFSSNKFLVNELKKKFKKVKLNIKGEKLQSDSLIRFIDGYESIIIGLEEINEKILTNSKNLKVISKYGVGIDRINLDALEKFDVKLKFVPGINKRAVSELTLALTLNILRNIRQLNTEVISGVWKQNKGRELTESRVGIVGFGNIGKDFCTLLKPFNCSISYFDPYYFENIYNQQAITKLSLEDIFKKCDIISIHLPLNSKTKNLITKKYLKFMSLNSILINTSRGNIVNEEDLYNCLFNKLIAGAGFDVMAIEPPKNYNLIKLNNFFITPHVGSSTVETIKKMGLAAIDSITNS